MDSEAIPSTTTTTARASTQSPLRMHTVIVFGDSLSDIGKKWTTKSGTAAIWAKEMYVSPTGRFSDCRNWTDFMFEAATGLTMIVDTADDSIALSKRHTSLTRSSLMLGFTPQKFQYANYAEGGACGDTPASKGPFLGTFKDQVDAFENDCKASRLPLGNTLFIIWFGANDLYTAGRKAAGMAQVAEQIAHRQRERLSHIVADQNQRTLRRARVPKYTCKFIFVDLCRPLTSVRYTMRLQNAEAAVRTMLGARYAPPTRPKWGGLPQGSAFQARHTLELAISLGLNPSKNWRGSPNEVELLRAQVEVVKNLEQGVLLFNATLRTITAYHGDRVAEVGKCVSEDTLRELVQGNFRLRSGAMGVAVKKHVSALSYNQRGSTEYATTVDQAHPTDQMYRLLWLEIYEQIKRSNCTFGALSPDIAGTTLTELSETPGQQTRRDYGAVMNQLLATRPRTAPTRPD